MGMNTVNEKLDLVAFDKDFELLLSPEGYAILVEGVSGFEIAQLGGVMGYVGSIVSAVHSGVAEGKLETEIPGSYGKLPHSVVLKLMRLLRGHGVELCQAYMPNGFDTVYWGSKQMK